MMRLKAGARPHSRRIVLNFSIIVLLFSWNTFVKGENTGKDINSLPGETEAELLVSDESTLQFQKGDIDKALERAVEADVVIIVTCAHNEITFFLNWAEFMRRIRLHYKFLVVVDKSTVFATLEKSFPHQVLMLKRSNMSTPHKLDTQGVRPKHLRYYVPLLLKAVLKRGLSVVFSELDVLWLKDPRPYFLGKYDLLVTMDDVVPDSFSSLDSKYFSAKHSPWFSSSFIFLQNTVGGFSFATKWVALCDKDGPGPHLNTVMERVFKSGVTVQVGILPQNLFVPGWIAFSSGFLKKNQDKIVTIHNNWVRTPEAKIRRFVRAGLWLVGESPKEKFKVSLAPTKGKKQHKKLQNKVVELKIKEKEAIAKEKAAKVQGKQIVGHSRIQQVQESQTKEEIERDKVEIEALLREEEEDRDELKKVEELKKLEEAEDGN